jgi:signal transduction histidine kinase
MTHFYKPAGKGTGMGMSINYQIIERYGGTEITKYSLL